MTATLELVRTPTLDEDAKTASSEHSLAVDSASEAVRHAILAGEALLRAKAQVARGKWLDWLQANFLGGNDYTAYVYMRLARYRDALAEHNPKSIEQGTRLLKELGLDRYDGSGSSRRVPIETKQEAAALRKAGSTWPQIGEVFGVSSATAQRWVEPQRWQEAEKRKQERRSIRRQENAALRQKQRDEAMRKRGGNASEAYSLMRKAAQELDRAIGREEDAARRAGLRQVLGKLHAAEDDLAHVEKVS